MIDSNFEVEMNRGFIQLLVLMVLDEPCHGYSIIKKLENLDYPIEGNTLYPLLRRLEGKGIIESNWKVGEGKPQKIYELTSEGLQLKNQLLIIWDFQNELIKKLRGEKHE